MVRRRGRRAGVSESRTPHNGPTTWRPPLIRLTLASLMAEIRHAADDEDLGVSSRRQVQLDDQASGTVELRAVCWRNDGPPKTMACPTLIGAPGKSPVVAGVRVIRRLPAPQPAVRALRRRLKTCRTGAGTGEGALVDERQIHRRTLQSKAAYKQTNPAPTSTTRCGVPLVVTALGRAPAAAWPVAAAGCMKRHFPK